MDKDIIKGIKFSFGIFLFFSILFGLVWAVGFHSANEILGGTFIGDYVFIGKLNLTKANVSGGDLNLIPSGAIMSFNLISCPNGWKPCDGTNETFDLRGQFIRGLNTFDNGITIRNDGKEDPVARSLGDFQNDALASHIHNYKRGKFSASGSTQWTPTGGGTDETQSTLSTGGTETRPNNVALIYCQKE